MSNQKHTPGPWGKCGLTILGPDQLQIAVAEAHPATAMECQEANARLIAAAPELLNLLIELIDIEGPQPGNAAWAEKVRSAIAKVTA